MPSGVLACQRADPAPAVVGIGTYQVAAELDDLSAPDVIQISLTGSSAGIMCILALWVSISRRGIGNCSVRQRYQRPDWLISKCCSTASSDMPHPRARSSGESSLSRPRLCLRVVNLARILNSAKWGHAIPGVVENCVAIRVRPVWEKARGVNAGAEFDRIILQQHLPDEHGGEQRDCSFNISPRTDRCGVQFVAFSSASAASIHAASASSSWRSIVAFSRSSACRSSFLCSVYRVVSASAASSFQPAAHAACRRLPHTARPPCAGFARLRCSASLRLRSRRCPAVSDLPSAEASDLPDRACAFSQAG